MLTGINENHDKEKPATEKLSEKARTTRRYLSRLRLFLSHRAIGLLIEHPQSEENERRRA